jgi:hypothetical protein
VQEDYSDEEAVEEKMKHDSWHPGGVLTVTAPVQDSGWSHVVETKPEKDFLDSFNELTLVKEPASVSVKETNGSTLAIGDFQDNLESSWSPDPALPVKVSAEIAKEPVASSSSGIVRNSSCVEKRFDSGWGITAEEPRHSVLNPATSAKLPSSPAAKSNDGWNDQQSIEEGEFRQTTINKKEGLFQDKGSVKTFSFKGSGKENRYSDAANETPDRRYGNKYEDSRVGENREDNGGYSRSGSYKQDNSKFVDEKRFSGYSKSYLQNGKYSDFRRESGYKDDRGFEVDKREGGFRGERGGFGNNRSNDINFGSRNSENLKESRAFRGSSDNYQTGSGDRRDGRNSNDRPHSRPNLYDNSLSYEQIDGRETSDVLPEWTSNEAPSSLLVENKASAARTAEYTEERDAEMEKKIFHNEMRTGIHFSEYDRIPVKISGPGPPKPIKTFAEAKELGVHAHVMKNIELCDYKRPTPIQSYGIPAVLNRRDLMGCALTGSGKTAAFLIPVISVAMRNGWHKVSTVTVERKATPLVLICAPTRELSCQIFDEARKFSYRTGFRPCVAYGGAPAVPQLEDMMLGCHMLICTPGRLTDFLDRGRVSLSKVRILILDEADRMLDMGFEIQIRKYTTDYDMTEKSKRQTLLFSATFPRPIQELAADFLRDEYLYLLVGKQNSACSQIQQEVLLVSHYEKREKLLEVLRSIERQRVLIFVQSKKSAEQRKLSS